MNDPSKAINVNLSSLLSLKAELLRKQAEVNKTKATRSIFDTGEYSNNAISTSSVGNKKQPLNDKGMKEISKEKDHVIFEHEDSELLAKSQRILIAKSKFYDRMSRTGGKLNSDDNSLVLFNRKQQDDRQSTNPSATASQAPIPSDSETSDSSSDDECKKPQSPTHGPMPDLHTDNNRHINDEDKNNTNDNDDDQEDDDDWVEYIDCLGRTRKCLRCDLISVKRRDEELAASMPERLDQSKANWMIDTKGDHHRTQSIANEQTNGVTSSPLAGPESIFSDGCSIMSKHDEQRANWERKEQENLEKADVHYQDVFFDEARQHGVGYYAFSTDEEERRRQQTELDELRKSTVNEQKRRDQLRLQREKIIATRVLAAKNRQRARAGLPPLEEEIEKGEKPKTNEETKEERKARKRSEKAKRRQEQEEHERVLDRQNHIRPWDADKKSGMMNENDETEEWKYKAERLPMSQEEWNEKKRNERVQEFAPPSNTTTHQRSVPLKRTNFTCVPPPPTDEKEYQYNLMPPPPPQAYSNNSNNDNSFNPFQTSAAKRETPQLKRRNYFNDQQSKIDTLIDVPARNNGGAEIPPPANLDIPRFPSSSSSHNKKSKSSIELERSIEAGLRFLRENCDKSMGVTKSTWTSKADY